MNATAPRRKLASMVLECRHAPTQPGDSILHDGRVIGSVTSSGWGYRTAKNIALGDVDAAFSALGSDLLVEAMGAPVQAKVVPECLYDPDNARVRA
ncbi:MAG: aminomethyl transferase family protein [Roseovarius sp.]|nr:aminomethyl transferase family protein [Roseovarius sp.]